MTTEKLLAVWKQKLPNVEPTNQELTAPAPQQEPSPTAGMNIAQRILHVGGRNNADGYVEFGSIQAVEALVRQVLRDLPAEPQQEAQGCALDVVLDAFENKTRGIPQAHIAAALVAELRAAIEAASTTPAAKGDAQDAARLDWLEADEMNRVFHLGKVWYTRASYGSPYRKRASLREAIDTARAAQEGKK